MKVKFVPQNVEFEVTPEKSLLQIATENHIEIKSICKGVPSCAECRVRVTEGENNVLPPNKAELALIGTNWRIDSRRLSCQMRCFGDVTVDLTEQLERQENQSKKVRGFRSPKQKESHAVQDTILLTEKPEDRAPTQQEPRPPQQQNQQQRPPQQKQQNQQGRQQQQGQGKQQNRQQQGPGKQQNQRNQNNPQAKQQNKPQDRQQSQPADRQAVRPSEKPQDQQQDKNQKPTPKN